MNIEERIKEIIDIIIANPQTTYYPNICNELIQTVISLQSQLKAKEEVIKEAREIVKYRLKENDGHINARMEMFHYRNLEEILSKGVDK